MASQCRLTAPAAWTTAPEPLKLMYPEADIVMQLSVQIHLGPVHHLDLGRQALRALEVRVSLGVEFSLIDGRVRCLLPERMWVAIHPSDRSFEMADLSPLAAA